MAEQYLLGIDIGTSSLKLSVLDGQTRLAACVSRPVRIVAPAADEAQLDAAFLWKKLEEGVSYSQLYHAVSEEYEIDDSEEAEAAITEFLEKIFDLGLLKRGGEMNERR